MSVVIVITRPEEIDETMCWGARFALAREQPMVVLYSSVYPQAKSPLRVPLEEVNSLPLLDKIREAARKIDVAEGETYPALYHLQGPDRKQGILACLKEHKATLLVTGHSSSRKKSADDPGPSLRQGLLDEAPCDMILLRARKESHETQKPGMLIPAAGGPHATAALRLAAKVSNQTDCPVKAIYIEQEAGEEAEAVGERVLKRVMQRAGIPAENKLKTGVVLADNVTQGILQAAREEEDLGLVLIGASNQGFIRRSLFGDVPNELLTKDYQMTVGVMRAAQPLVERTKAFFGELFERWLPQLTREERIGLFERLQNGSQASIDFIALICLSTTIAALGLLQNSGAVIIGAMLVAPLMTPMLGMGLGLVQGNIVLVRKAVFSIAVGFLLSFGIGLVIGLMVPSFRALTSEMLARGQPNLLDLFVALFSGIAAAYALARPGLLEALPGVAIAAALVPPIATAGASLALGRVDNAVGAASLFGVNLVAIIVASSCTLYVMGIRAHKSQKRLWARRTLIGLAMLAMLIAVPLGTTLLGTIPNPFKPLTTALTSHLKKLPGVSLARLERKERASGDIIELQLYTPRQLSQGERLSIAKVVRRYVGPKARIRLVSTLVHEYGLPTPVVVRKKATKSTPTQSKKKAKSTRKSAAVTGRKKAQVRTPKPAPVPRKIAPKQVPRTRAQPPRPATRPAASQPAKQGVAQPR